MILHSQLSRRNKIISMNSFKQKIFFFFLLNLATIKSSSLTTKLESNWWTPRYEVHISSSLPINSNPLKLHCKSRDDDLGDVELRTNEELKFHFNEHFLGGTLYFCHFYWGPKDTSHDIFNDKIADKCGLISKGYSFTFIYGCYWKIAEDGFYFNSQELPQPDKQYTKLYGW